MTHTSGHRSKLLHTLVFLHLKRWMQKLYGLLKLPLCHVSRERWSRTSLEIVVGSLHKYLAISRNEWPLIKSMLDVQTIVESKVFLVAWYKI